MINNNKIRKITNAVLTVVAIFSMDLGQAAVAAEKANLYFAPCENSSGWKFEKIEETCTDYSIEVASQKNTFNLVKGSADRDQITKELAGQLKNDYIFALDKMTELGNQVGATHLVKQVIAQIYFTGHVRNAENDFFVYPDSFLNIQMKFELIELKTGKIIFSTTASDQVSADADFVYQKKAGHVHYFNENNFQNTIRSLMTKIIAKGGQEISRYCDTAVLKGDYNYKGGF